MRPFRLHSSRDGKMNLQTILVCVVLVAIVASSPQTVGTIVRHAADSVLGAISTGMGTQKPKDFEGPAPGTTAPQTTQTTSTTGARK